MNKDQENETEKLGRKEKRNKIIWERKKKRNRQKVRTKEKGQKYETERK